MLRPEQRPALVELAKTLARDIDNPDFTASHSVLSRELRATLDVLRQGVGGRGRLALVAHKSAPRQNRNPAGSSPIA